MKEKKKSDNSTAVFLGVFIFVMLLLILASYYRPDKMIGRKSFGSSTEVFKKPAVKSTSRKQNIKTAAKSEQSNSKKQSAPKGAAGNIEKPHINTSLISPRVSMTGEAQEKDAEARKAIFLYYHKPFLEKKGISTGAVNKVMELYSNYDAAREIMHSSYDMDIQGNEALRKLKSGIKLSRANYDIKITNILGKKNFDQYDLFDKSLPNRELVNHFNDTLDGDKKIHEKTKEELILSLYNSDELLFSKNQDIIKSASNDHSAYDRIRALQKKEYLYEAKKILNKSQYSRFAEFLEDVSK